MNIYFHQKFLQLSYNPDKQLGLAVWNGFLNSEEFKMASEACINMIEEHQITHWLADNRKMKAIRQQDQDWFLKVIVPRLAQSPLRKMATLVSEDLFNKMAVESMHLKAGDYIKFDNFHFKNEAEALVWLAADITTSTNISSSGK